MERKGPPKYTWIILIGEGDSHCVKTNNGKTESGFSSFLIVGSLFLREVSLNSVEQNDEDANICWSQFCIDTSSYISCIQQ
ncbi:hypothetical protein V6N12_051634 [Hibiscus sabdariffa]|uniref:Uncharacterized protein n=1 Tax=Hibiscus sabdariffa TaxID=183260 RepID=A0ABR2GFY2_9ROSI